MDDYPNYPHADIPPPPVPIKAEDAIIMPASDDEAAWYEGKLDGNMDFMGKVRLGITEFTVIIEGQRSLLPRINPWLSFLFSLLIFMLLTVLFIEYFLEYIFIQFRYLERFLWLFYFPVSIIGRCIIAWMRRLWLAPITRHAFPRLRVHAMPKPYQRRVYFKAPDERERPCSFFFTAKDQDEAAAIAAILFEGGQQTMTGAVPTATGHNAE